MTKAYLISKINNFGCKKTKKQTKNRNNKYFFQFIRLKVSNVNGKKCWLIHDLYPKLFTIFTKTIKT